MKTIKTIFTILAFTTLFSCSSDDDSHQPTVAELLTSGKWYFESMTIAPLNNCGKNTFIQFFENGNAYTETYSLDGAGECVLSQVNSGTYELISDTQLSTTTAGETNSSLVIVQISETQLILRDESGSTHNTITLDKTQG